MIQATTQRSGVAALNAHLIGLEESRALLETPALVLDLDRLEANVRRLATAARAADLALRPHFKTHKCLAIARLQVEAGARGISAAKTGEVEVLATGGIDDILLTTPLVSARKIARIAAWIRSGTRITVVVDHPRQIPLWEHAAEAEDVTVPVLVDLDVGQGRTGVAGAAEALELARAVEASPWLVFAGLQAYAGHLQHVRAAAARHAALASAMSRLDESRTAIENAGIAVRVVSGGGTGSCGWDLADRRLTELQCGSYLFMDAEYLALDQELPAPPAFEPALWVLATVVAHQGEDGVLLDAGTKALSGGNVPPRAELDCSPPPVFEFAGDEFSRLAGVAPGRRPPVGARLALIPAHCDPTVNLHDSFHCVRGEDLVDIWPVDARGRFD